MTGKAHRRVHWRIMAILAVLAVAEFVWAPILSSHHHHSDATQSQQCAVCVFASAHATPATASQSLVEPLGIATLAPTPPTPPLPTAPVCTHNQRGPPTA